MHNNSNVEKVYTTFHSNQDYLKKYAQSNVHLRFWEFFFIQRRILKMCIYYNLFDQ